MEKVITNQISSESKVISMGNGYYQSRVSAEKLTIEMAETNEDSSYDSDFETDETYTTEPTLASRSSSVGLSSHHDVSRTVSDTLGAEFAEYVNAAQLNDDFKKSLGYTARLEFGLKLGYTEALINKALKRLKPEPLNNELLEELIKLSAFSPKGIVAFKDEHRPLQKLPSGTFLRHIVIDGSNVAMSHGINSGLFSCKGIKICVDWFKARGHREITVFVPKWRKEPFSIDNQITDQEILTDLENERTLVFTPSRKVSGKRYVCYDDRYVLKLAAQVDGIVVSNDNYRDLIQENAEFRKVIEERILMFSFVNDRFMPPDDPMGRSGPTLDTFLTTKTKRAENSHCPYGRKCTYGNKCRYNHPERGIFPQKPVADQLTDYVNKTYIKNKEALSKSDLKTMSLPLSCENNGAIPKKMPLSRTRSAAPAPSLPSLDPSMQASMVSNFNRAQMEYQQHAPLDYRIPTIGPMEPPYKSHSIDNLATTFQDMNLLPITHSSSQNLNYSQQNVWGSPDTSPIGDQTTWNNVYNINYQDQQHQQEPNMHRKLHRQLTLNPNYDPRLYTMHGGSNINNPQGNNMWSSHQTVGRMASDPTAGPSWASPNWGNPHSGTTLNEARSRTHFLLLSIFPEEKVLKAMSMLPEETDPQKICAFIISHS